MAIGLGAVVERSVVVFTAIKLLGAAHLVVLGIRAIRNRRDLGAALETAASVQPRGSVIADGFIVGLANPKVIVFLAAILPQFVDPVGAPAGVQMAVLGLVFVAIAVCSDGAWGLAAGTAQEWFARSPRTAERFGVAGGMAMIGLGVKLALTGRAD